MPDIDREHLRALYPSDGLSTGNANTAWGQRFLHHLARQGGYIYQLTPSSIMLGAPA